jgi:hypothetical protein
MDYFRTILSLAIAGTGVAAASQQFERTPWTKSYLETRSVVSVDRYSLDVRNNQFRNTPKHQMQGTLYLSSAPLEDWEFDLGLQGRSLPTGKLFLSAEHQVLSDLYDDPLALTIVVDGSSSGRRRSTDPVFFEMARHVAQGGIGLGKHIFNQKNYYTQIFSYLLGGMGSSRAKYLSAEFGVQHVISQRHLFRISVLHIKTFGPRKGEFHGIGTLHTDVNGVACSYAYRWYNGIECRLSYIRRWVVKSGIRASTTCQVGISIPISL